MRDWSAKYMLLGHKVVVTHDLFEWARWFETANRVVRHTYTEFHWVSTVFVGIDMGFGEGPPIVFETMAFEKERHLVRFTDANGQVQEYEAREEFETRRYATWEEAEIGHDQVVNSCLKKEEIATNMVIFPKKEKS